MLGVFTSEERGQRNAFYSDFPFSNEGVESYICICVYNIIGVLCPLGLEILVTT